MGAAAIIGGAVLGSAVIGGGMSAIGANQQKQALKGASATQERTAQSEMELQKQMFDTQREDFAPYQKMGTDALPGLSAYDVKGPDYDTEVTNKLGDYTQSEGYQAQNALAQKANQRQLQARGLNYGSSGAESGAELSQKLTASDYDKYRGQLADRYNVLQSQNQTGYNALLNQVKIGQGAAGSAASAAGQMSSLGSQTLQNQGNNQAQNLIAQGNSRAQMWSGIGSSATSTINTGLSAYGGGMFSGGGATTYKPNGEFI